MKGNNLIVNIRLFLPRHHGSRLTQAATLSAFDDHFCFHWISCFLKLSKRIKERCRNFSAHLCFVGFVSVIKRAVNPPFARWHCQWQDFCCSNSFAEHEYLHYTFLFARAFLWFRGQLTHPCERCHCQWHIFCPLLQHLLSTFKKTLFFYNILLCRNLNFVLSLLHPLWQGPWQKRAQVVSLAQIFYGRAPLDWSGLGTAPLEKHPTFHPLGREIIRIGLNVVVIFITARWSRNWSALR